MSATPTDLARVLETIASRSPYAHLIVGPNGRIEHANITASILLGLDADEIAGTALVRWVPGFRAERDRPISGVETEVVTAQSDRIPVEIALTPLDDGESRAWITLHDITRRRGLEGSVRSHAEELEKVVTSRARSLAALHQRLRTLYDVAPILDFTIDSEGAISSANRKAFLSLGVAIDKLIGVPLLEVVLPDQRVALQAALNAARTEGSAPFETKLRSADGATLDVLFHSTPDEAGSRGSMRLLGLDLTARREAERLVDQSLDLAESQRARMERILRGIADGIVVMDADGQVRLMNGIAESLLGVEERFAFGRDLFADQRDARFVEAWTKFAGGDDDVLRAELASEGRESRALAVTISRIRTAEGRTAGSVVVLRDATTQRAADQKSRELLLDVAQGLRSSIASIRGFTGALVRDENASQATIRRFLGLLAKEANRVHRTIEHLVALARLDVGRDPLNVQEASFLKVFADVENSFAPGARVRGILLEVHPGDVDGRGRFDAEKVRRIIDLLVNGAMKRSTTGGSVRVELRRDDVRFEVTVRDTGTAFASAEIDLDPVLVRRLVTLHGGGFEQELPPGGGNVSRFWIPADPLEGMPVPAREGKRSSTSTVDALIDDPDGDLTIPFLEESPLEDS